MDIKCIALDLDGTTLCSDKNITDITRSAICEAIDAGIQVVVASGRCLDALPEAVTKIEGISYAITSNGAAVYDLRSGECLRRVTLSQAAVEKILEVTEDKKLVYEAFYQRIPYAPHEYVEDPLAHGAMPFAVDYIHSTRHPVPDIREFIQAHKQELDGLDLITRDKSLWENLWILLRDELQDVYITSSVPNRIEIADKKAGKHSGLQYILERISASPEQAAAFGDADNDIEMLSYVKYGMAVANGTDKCKRAACCTVPSNMENGVAVGIRKLLEM